MVSCSFEPLDFKLARMPMLSESALNEIKSTNSATFRDLYLSVVPYSVITINGNLGSSKSA